MQVGIDDDGGPWRSVITLVNFHEARTDTGIPVWCPLTKSQIVSAYIQNRGKTMITIIDSLNRNEHTALLENMHRLRAQVFQGRLGWDVNVVGGMEIDKFDDLDPAHIVNVGSDGRVLGCMRLLQTTGPHMLADVFSPLLDGEPPLRSSSIWEATRFCVDTGNLGRGKGPNTISYVTSEIMIGAFEFGLASGIKDAVAVIDPIMDRVMKRSGNAPSGYLGSPKPMGKVTALAALMDCTKERIESIRAYSGIRHDVFSEPNVQIAAM